MADGRKIPYLIELAADDKKIRQQMAKINWEELLGSKGKGFGDVLVSDAKDAKDQIKRTLGGLDVDWSKILGAKEIGQLEQAVTKALSKSRKEIELFAASGDTTGLEKTIKYVSALGEELKGLGSSFDAASLARGMSAFMKVLTPLTAKFEALADEPKKVEAAFDRLFSGIATSAKSVDLGKTFDVSGKIKIAMQGLKATNEEILEATESLEKYRNMVAKLSGDNPATIKLAQDVAGLNQQLDEQMRKEEQLAAQNKTNSAQYAATLKNIMAIENARLKLKEKPTTDYTGMEIREDFGYYEKQINKVVERISKKMEEVEGKLANTVDKSFAEIISKQISDIKLSVSLSEQSQAEFIGKINDFVQNVNKSPIEKVQIGVKPLLDESANLIENKQKRGYGLNEADEDVNTTKLIAQTEKRFKGIRGAMYRNQNKILQQTKEWRQQMLEQFKFKSGDFEFKFNNSFVEELQTLFDEYGLKVNIDPTYLADQIKTVLEGSSISLGGGVASVDPSAMASAVMAGVRAALVGEPLTVHTPVNAAQERIPDATEQVATEIEQTAKHLDIAEEYVQDVVKKIKAVAKYAVKPTDKDTISTKATREQFKLWGVDLEKVLGATDDTQIATMLESSLLKRGDFNKLIGSTVIDELSAFKGSSSNTISAFVDSLREMFYMLQEDTETVEEWTRKKHSREIFDYAQGQAKAANSLRDVRSPIRTGKTPDIEYIDKAITAMSAIGKNTDSLTALRLAREKLGSKTDEQSVQEFNAVANDFYKSTTKVFYDIKRQAEDAFQGTVYLQGGKKGVVKKQHIESYKQLARIGEDDVILDIRVTSGLNNVALGTTKSKYKDRISPYEEKRLLDGKRGDYVVSKEYEKDILNRPLEYGGFKPKGMPTTDMNLDATLEANVKKREALMAEVRANEEEKKLLREQIESADKQIAELTAKNNEIPQGRKNAALRKVADYEAKKAELTNDIFWLEEQVGNDKEGDEKKVGSLTKQIEEQLSKRASAEKQLTELSELDVERRKKSLTNEITEIESNDLPKLQEELTKAQIKYSVANSDKILAQVEVNKANSALKAIPKTKANAEARAEAETRVTKANRELASATERFEGAARDVDSITTQIENNKRKIENLQSRISETTLESVRQEQINRIETINNVITSLENEFASKLAEKKAKGTSLKRTNTTLDRARNDVALRTQRELDDAITVRDSLITKDKGLDATTNNNQNEIARLEALNQRVEAEKEYNALQEKSLILQGSIKKMEEDGATEEALSEKRTELEKINTTLSEALEKVQTLGGFIAQHETKEYSDAERKTYALEQIKRIDDDLITARAQKSVVAARIAKKDREIAEVDRWGLGAGIGARTLNQEKYNATSEFMNSDYVHSLIDAVREQTKSAIAEAVGKSELAETEALRGFNEKIASAMTKDGLNPHSAEQTQAFLKTTRGKQYSEDYNAEIASIQNSLQESTRELWSAYDERVKAIRSQVSAEFKESMKVDNGVLSYASKIKDESGEWINELVEVYVRDALRKRLTDVKEILEEEQAPMQSNIDRLYADRKSAIEYGGVGEKEILSADVIEDQIRREEKLAQAQEKRAASIQKIGDLEQAGVKDSDESIKQEKKKLAETEKQISQLEMLIRNRKKLVELRWDESKADSYTDEEKELHFTEQVVSYNQKIEDSLLRQEALKQKIAIASEEEKAKLQYQLSQEEDKVAKWRKNILTIEGKLQQIETSKSEVAATKTSEVSGGLLGLIKEAVGEVGVGDLTKVEEILSKILAILSGNGVVGSTRSSEMDAKLARIKELEAKQQLANEQKKTAETVKQVENAKKETAVTTNAADSKAHKNVSKTQVYKDVQKSVDTFRTSELTADKEPLNAIKLALDELSKINDQNSQEYVEWQRKLGSALAAYGKKNGIENGKGYYDKVYSELEKNGVAIDPKLPITNKSGISNALVEKGLVTIKEKEAKAKQSEAKAEEKITEEKKEQEQIRFTRKERKELNRLKSETKDYNPDAATGVTSEFGGFATENTLRAILEVLGKISTSGVPKSGGGSKTSTPKNANDPIPNETSDEVDEITAKIDKLKVKFADAMQVGYLGKKDTGLKDFEKQLKKIDKAIADGDSIEKLEKMRKKAVELGDIVNKTIADNKRKYSGTTEMNAATRQRSNMEARGVLDNADLAMVQEYNKAYSDLMTTHKKFASKGTLYDPNNQKTLQNMAIKVKDLGKQLEKSHTNFEDLQQKVAESGVYNGKAIGDLSQVEQGTDIYDQMRAKLEELGATNIKVDRIHQRATGTIRHNNRLVSDLEVSYDELTGSLARYHKQERESLTGVPAFLNGFKKKFNSIMQYLSMTMSIHQVIAELRKGVQYVREIDLALTELKKVTNETEETYDKFLRTAAKTGARLGSTISAVTEATATFAKLGYSMEQATEMAEAAIVYKNVGDNIASTEDAADSIISTMKGFKLEATESMRIVDRFNEVGNKFAITSQGIGEALRLSASALSEGGNSLDESIGLITAANEVVNDPSSVGTALKTKFCLCA